MESIDKQKVAFILSVYKNDKMQYFQEAIWSIYRQTYGKENIQIYLCIDGPIDEDLEQFIEKEKDNFIIVRNEKNEGLAFALNRLIDLVEEKYIFRMDSDDVCYFERVEEQLSFLHQHPDVMVLGSCVEIIDEEGNKKGIRCFPSNNEQARRKICFSSPFAHPTICFRKELFDSGIRYDNQYRYAQDLELWFRILGRNFKIANIPKPLLRYRIHENLKKRSLQRLLFYELPILLKGSSQIRASKSCIFLFSMKVVLRLLPFFIKKTIYKIIWKNNESCYNR